MLVRSILSRRQLEVLIFVGVLLLLAAIFLPAIQNARDSARQTQSKNNLKQIAFALYNYHDTFDVLPPGGIIRDDGAPMHGWLASLVPYLEVTPHMTMFDFNYSWDHPFNLRVMTHQWWSMLNPSVEMPSVQPAYGVTHYRGNQDLLHRNSSVSFDDVEGGLQHCWMASEVSGGQRPYGFPFNWRGWKPTLTGDQSFINPHRDGAIILYADGHAAFVKTDDIALSRNPIDTITEEDVARPESKFDHDFFLIDEVNLHATEDDFLQILVFERGEITEVVALLYPLTKEISFREIDRRDWGEIAEVAVNAQKLVVHGQINESTAKELPKLQSLIELYVDGIVATEEVIDSIGRMTKLKKLTVRNLAADERSKLQVKLPDISIE